jgi:hypothetical protein
MRPAGRTNKNGVGEISADPDNASKKLRTGCPAQSRQVPQTHSR